MFCNKCGNELKEGVSFCKYCGNEILRSNKVTQEKNDFIREDKENSHNSENIKTQALVVETKYSTSNDNNSKILHEEDKENLNVSENGKTQEQIDENKQVRLNNNTSISLYEENLLRLCNKEKKIDKIIEVIAVIATLGFSFYYDGLDAGHGPIVCLLAGAFVVSILGNIFVMPFVNGYKKSENCYKCIEKYEKFLELKASTNEEVAIQTVEIEYSNIYNKKKHGLLYYLICVLLIIIIFAFF